MRKKFKRIRRGIAVLLSVALAVSQPTYSKATGSADGEEVTGSSLGVVLTDEDSYAPHQVIVKYRKGALVQKQGTSKILKAAREEKHVSVYFGRSMKAVTEEKDVATTTKKQTRILSQSMEADFVIEDTVSFSAEETGGEPLVYSLVSSEKYSTAEMMSLLRENKDVSEVIPNGRIEPESVPDYELNDPYSRFSYQQNTSEAMNTVGRQVDDRGYEASQIPSQNLSVGWEKADRAGKPEKEIVVAVIDTGVDTTHEDLKDVMWQNPGNIGLLGEHGYDFNKNKEVLTDPDGHGTHCAGVIAAQAGNSLGISGGAGGRVKIMGLKIMNDEGSGTSNYLFGVLGAFEYVLKAKRMGVNVALVSNSWGMSREVDGAGFYEDIFKLMKQAGILNFIAAGNSGYDDDTANAAPGDMESDNVVTVGAMGENGKAAPFSQYGNTSVDVFTPGTNILSTVSYDCYFPAIYSPEKLKETTAYYGEFSQEQGASDGTFIPVTGDDGAMDYTGVKRFGASKVKLPAGASYELKVEKGNYFNTSKAPASLNWTVHGLKPGESYYMYFPYEKDEDSEENDTYFSALYKAVWAGDDIKLTVRTGEVIEKKDGTLEMYGDGVRGYAPMKSYDGLMYHTTGAVSSYRQTKKKDVASYGIGICLSVPEDAAQLEHASATLCLDSIAVSKAGVKKVSFGKYDIMSGTSMACPAAAGAAALLSYIEPEGSEAAGRKTGSAYADYLKNRLLSMTTHSGELEGKCLTEGYIDFKKFDVKQPVITNAYVLSDTGDILLEGMNLGSKETTEVQYRRLAVEGSEYKTIPKDSGGGMYVSWDMPGDSILVLHGAKELIGTYTRFLITNGEASGTGAFFLVQGIGKYVPVTTADHVLEDIFTDSDGQEVYALTREGDVGRLDVNGGTLCLYNEKKTFKEQLKMIVLQYMGISEFAYYNDAVSFSTISTVHMDGVFYHMINVQAGADQLKVLALIDVNSPNPVWGFMKLSEPEEGLYNIFGLDGRLYSFGGRAAGETGNVVDRHVSCLNMKTGKWERIDAELPEDFIEIHGCTYDGALYLMCCQIYDNGGNVKDSNAVWRFDGANFTRMKTEIRSPFRHSYSAGYPALRPALAEAKNGIVGTGISIDGCGNSFRYSPKEDKLYPIWRTLDDGLAAAAVQKAVVTAKGLYLYRAEIFDDIWSPMLYHLDAGNDTFETQYEVKASTDDTPATTTPAVTKQKSKAKLVVTKKAIKRGKSYKIKVKNLNGQKISCSVSKKTKKRGVTVSSSGKVSVKKKAKKGTYKVKVKVDGNASFKAKILKFTVVVKK